MYAVIGHLENGAGGNLQQTLTANVHEITTDVQVHGVARLRPVLALLTYVHPKAVNAVMRAAPYDTRVGVLYESTFKELVAVVEVEMVHNTVSEHSREHFSLLRVLYHESTWTVGLYNVWSEDHRRAHPYSSSDVPRTYGHKTSWPCAGGHHRKQHKGQAAVGLCSAYIPIRHS